MSRDFSSKGGRAGSKNRKHAAKAHSAHSSGLAGKDGVEAWSANSIADFNQDQALLEAYRQQVAAAEAAKVAPAASADTPASAAPVDGSLLEGGGQVLRNAIAYSALLSRPIGIHRIRAGRASGGLKAQHLKGIELVHSMVGGALRGANLQSREVEFEPGAGAFDQIKENLVDPSQIVLEYKCDIGTAGATGLLIQTALPVSLFMPYPVELTLRGGTNASMAPVVDYSMMVFAPLMSQWFGLKFDFELLQRGFFPKGGGCVKVHTQPITRLKAINITERGRITKITGLSFVTHRLPAHIADRMAEHARKLLHKEMRDVPIEIESWLLPESEATMGDGVSLILLAHTSTGCIFGSSGLGERGKPAEDVASECASQLVANLSTGGCMDEYCQDQVILWMALAEGTSVIKTGPLTMHTRTCLFWAQYFTGCQVQVVPARGNTSMHQPEMSDTQETFLIHITGIGYKSRFTNQI